MSWFACFTIALAMAMVVWRWPPLRGTTLVGPGIWLLVALAAIGMFELLSARKEAWLQLDSLRLILSSVTLCPAISLVGAKRPQDKPWHFIVASLWIVMMLPGIQSLVLGSSEQPEAHPARSWFLVGLLLFAIANSVFSRYWLCVLLAGFGATVLVSPFLPTVLHGLSELNPALGAMSYSTAVILGVILSYRIRSEAKPLDALWRDFRDAFGLLWTLRIAERINATAQANGWNIRASWNEIRSDAELTGEQSRLFRQNLSNLLRRFVNDEWITKRLDDGQRNDECRSPNDEGLRKFELRKNTNDCH